MSASTPAAARKPQHDYASAAYRRSRKAEVWVKQYVDKMNLMPAKPFVRQEAR